MRTGILGGTFNPPHLGHLHAAQLAHDALKLDRVDEFLRGLEKYSYVEEPEQEFGARVFKISRDEQGGRLTWLRVTGGTLKVKDTLTGTAEEEEWQEKVNQIRVYSGTKYETVNEAEAGMVCAVTGLTKTRAGEGLGTEHHTNLPVLEPVLNYKLTLPRDCDPVQLLVILYIRIVRVDLNFLDLCIIVLVAVQHIDRIDRLIVPLPLSVSSGQYSLHVIVEGDFLRDIINLCRDLIQDVTDPQVVRLQKITVIVHQNLVGISDEKRPDQQDRHHDRHKVNHIQLLPDACPAQKAVPPAPWFSFAFLFMNFFLQFVGIIHRYCTVFPL